MEMQGGRGVVLGVIAEVATAGPVDLCDLLVLWDPIALTMDGTRRTWVVGLPEWRQGDRGMSPRVCGCAPISERLCSEFEELKSICKLCETFQRGNY